MTRNTRLVSMNLGLKKTKLVKTSINGFLKKNLLGYLILYKTGSRVKFKEGIIVNTKLGD